MARDADPLFSDRRLAATYDVFEGERPDLDVYEQIVVELSARSVLDVGSGTGELACRLARRGVDVSGVDPAEASVDIARSKPDASRVSWFIGDATSLPPMQIDLALLTGNVAQVFVTDDEWNATLLAIARAVRPGGHLVFETRRPSRRAWEQWTPEHTRTSATLADGEVVETWCQLRSVELPFVTFRWTTVFSSDEATLTSDSTLRFRERDELEDSLGEAGFDVIDVREAPDRPGMEMVVVARRR